MRCSDKPLRSFDGQKDEDGITMKKNLLKDAEGRKIMRRRNNSVGISALTSAEFVDDFHCCINQFKARHPLQQFPDEPAGKDFPVSEKKIVCV
jgi:hypothetical protein